MYGIEQRAHTHLPLSNPTLLTYPSIMFTCCTRRSGQMSRASAFRVAGSQNLNLAGSNPDHAGFNTGHVKPMSFKLILVAS